MASPTRHANSLDHVRLLLAALVIFSHSFDMLSRHDALSVFSGGRVAFGGLAVCGFFGLSGYLISSSWDAKRSLAPYLRNRLLRIGPGFAAAFLFSVFVVGAVGAANAGLYYAALPWPTLARELLTLHQPSAPMPGPYSEVNGALWTIRYEFLCYLLTPLFLIRREVLLVLWPIVAALTAVVDVQPCTWLLMFLSGAVVHAYNIRPTPRWAWIAAPGFILSLRLGGDYWEIGAAVFGVYVMLAIGLRPSPFKRTLPDVSYGTYLYGWPTQKLVILAGAASPWVVAALAIPISMALGLASWTLVEERFLRLKASAPLRNANDARVRA